MIGLGLNLWRAALGKTMAENHRGLSTDIKETLKIMGTRK